MPRSTPTALVLLASFVATACSSGSGEDGASLGVEVPDDFRVDVVVEDLRGPTQFLIDDDGRLVVAQLAGAEDAAEGQVLSIDLDDPTDRTVLADDLDVPTGVARWDGDLWIMEATQLTRRSPEPGAEAVTVAGDLPNNGRSQGTLTVIDDRVDGGLWWNTSGRQRAGRVTPGSGTVFTVLPEDQTIAAAAEHLKHGYAHTPSVLGVFVTEIGDGRFDDRVPRDELNLIRPLDERLDRSQTDPLDLADVLAASTEDFGWPRCIDDRVPVVEFDATPADCAATRPPHALFAERSTPTSVVVSPWDPNQLLVALWVDRTVVTVPVAPTPDGSPHDEGEVFATFAGNPQHLLVVDDEVWVSDHTGGRIIAIGRT